MTARTLGSGRAAQWRSLVVAAVAALATLWSTAARATITQGDFSVFGFFETREEGRWGQGTSALNGTPTTFTHPTPTTTVAAQGLASSTTGGTWEFNHWDLSECGSWRTSGPTTTWSRTTSSWAASTRCS